MKSLKTIIEAATYTKDQHDVPALIIRKPANTWVANWMKALRAHFVFTGYNMTDTAGDNQSIDINYYDLKVNAQDDITTFGILIGSDNTPVTLTQYNLQSQLTTDIHHNEVQVILSPDDPDTMQVTISRTFINNTGAPVQVEEVGLFSEYKLGPKHFMLDRTLLSVQIPTAGNLNLTYKLQTYTT